ncbi:MAG: hypothetical protein GC160_01500 [Acidobacteria bacterium]|nr:hypothetical protein [Acidobacteriota bacterium]
MNHDPLLESLRELAAEQAGDRPSAAVEQSLREAVRRRHGVRRVRLALGGLAAAAALTVAIWTGMRMDEPETALAPAPETPSYRVTEFLPLDLGHPDPRTVTAGRLTRVTLPPTAPSSMGLPISPYAFPEGIQADLLLSEDGTPQAVRFVVPYR